jgi:hypothetical protein
VFIPPAGGSADRPVAAGTRGRPVWALLTVATGGLLAAAAVTAIRARRIR